MLNIFTKIQELINTGNTFALATIIIAKGSTPRKPGAKMLITENETFGTIGGGLLEHRVINLTRKMIKEGQKNQILKINIDNNEVIADGGICGGYSEIFIEIIENENIFYIYGGGHVAQALARVFNILNYRYIIIDDRIEFANKDIFPRAKETICTPFNNFFKEHDIISGAYHIIMTRGHKDDFECAKNILRHNAKYIGLIGSKKKSNLIKNELKKSFSEEIVNSIHSPIGIEINADTPEEIAISISAEIINIKNG